METIFCLLIKFFGSQIFANLLLLGTVIVAFIVGRRQVALIDVVEIYAFPSTKEIRDENNNFIRLTPVVFLQNTGTRLLYLDKYIFNGNEHVTEGQVLPPTYSQSNAFYWIDLPYHAETKNVSLDIYYHDADFRYWESKVRAVFENGSWRVISLPRFRSKNK